MRPSGLVSLAAVSLSLFLAVAAPASTRPRYGGTLRLAMREAPTSLDPVDSGAAIASVSRLIFDTLVTLDARGQTQPALSSSWQADPGNQRWQFKLRSGVTFHDETAVSSDAVAASLRVANPNWKIFAAGDAVTVECNVPTANLPAVLALPRNGIAKRSSGKVAGSGPFAINRWEPGRTLSLSARDEYWGGRSFVDSIEIGLGKSFRDQMIALDLGKADIVQIAPDQARRAALDGRRLESSAPAEWMGLVFGRDIQSTEEAQLRAALALSLDRVSMNNVLLQGGGEPAGALLPDWMTGYAFLFPTTFDSAQARQLGSQAHSLPAWTLGYDLSDALVRVIAERIALNARDAGLSLHPMNSNAADVRLLHMAAPSLNAQAALREFASALGLPSPRFEGDPAASLYPAESALLQSRRVIPILYLRKSVALGPGVRGWQEDPDGSWHLENVWLETGKP